MRRKPSGAYESRRNPAAGPSSLGRWLTAIPHWIYGLVCALIIIVPLAVMGSAYRASPTGGASSIAPPGAVSANNPFRLLVGAVSMTGPSDGAPPSTPTTPAGLQGNAVPVEIALPRLRITVYPGLYPGQGEALSAQIAAALADVQTRMGYAQPPPIEVRVVRDDACALRGATYDEARVVLVYTCNQIAYHRAVSILAHEFIHQLAFEHYGPRAGRSDLMLIEGLATFGAGKYWLGSYSSFRDLVRDQRAAKIDYPLQKDFFNQSPEVMNAIYYQWASFVEFLRSDARYAPRFDELYTSGDGSIGSADYSGLYGKDLATLEQEWRAWVDGGSGRYSGSGS